MRFFYRTSGIIFISLILFSQVVFAQGIDAQKLDIYSKLKDPLCVVSLEKSYCPTAMQMRGYIDALLEVGVAKDEIFYKVTKKFTPQVLLDKKLKAGIEQRLIKEAGGKRAQIIPGPVTSNFGKVSKKQSKVNKIFKLYNKGNVDLVLTNVRVSCPCVSASLKIGKNKSSYFGVAGAGSGWQTVIEPGKSGELEVALDLNHASMGMGKQIRNVFVSNNDPLNPEATLTVEIEVME